MQDHPAIGESILEQGRPIRRRGPDRPTPSREGRRRGLPRQARRRRDPASLEDHRGRGCLQRDDVGSLIPRRDAKPSGATSTRPGCREPVRHFCGRGVRGDPCGRHRGVSNREAGRLRTELSSDESRLAEGACAMSPSPHRGRERCLTEPIMSCVHREGRPRSDAILSKTWCMNLDRRFGDEEPLCDLAVRESRANQVVDLALAD